MKAVGIISEFNPLHKGHEYFFSQVKSKFPEKGIVCVMSGNFVQRGSFAIQEKYSRARSALFSGADLVLELPFPFSCLSAESFGKSGVSILSRLGICDTIAFGSEIDDGEALITCAKRIASPAFQDALNDYLKENKGAGYPAAREKVYEALFGRQEILSSSNASLALEYLSAAFSLSAPFSFYPVKRMGEGIRSEKVSAFSSATAIRRCLFAGEDVSDLVPPQSLEEMEKEREKGRFPVSMEKLSPVLFYLLKTKSRKELKEIYGFASLCDRAKKYAGECDSIEDLVQRIKNASVTDSRIRRGLLSLLCQIPRGAERALPAYTLVLGANEKGRQLLSQIREESCVPVFTKPTHALRSPDASVVGQTSAAYLADEIYAMAFPKKAEEGYFLKKMPAMI